MNDACNGESRIFTRGCLTLFFHCKILTINFIKLLSCRDNVRIHETDHYNCIIGVYYFHFILIFTAP